MPLAFWRRSLIRKSRKVLHTYSRQLLEDDHKLFAQLTCQTSYDNLELVSPNSSNKICKRHKKTPRTTDSLSVSQTHCFQTPYPTDRQMFYCVTEEWVTVRSTHKRWGRSFRHQVLTHAVHTSLTHT
ncbi:unnamed protein product [Ceratitis capitata]|uniref:(Mediterranean fruit fly) hypothetical protein n=1 Tax=Ceratitis capitata TaxID=7213 RepID=A0A811UNL6_CERCA|nr:unnamed protein product [Ceratitis capitata]